MKKLLLLLLIAPLFGFGQVLTDVFYIWQQWDEDLGKEVYTNINTANQYEDYYLSVPAGKTWQIAEISVYRKLESGLYSMWQFDNSTNNTYRLILFNNPAVNEADSETQTLFSVNDYDIEGLQPIKINLNHSFIPSNTKFFFRLHDNDKRTMLKIKEYSFNSNNSLSSNYPEAIQNNSNTPVLFPNPTSSLLALNSDKEYDIEVYDMLGNKIMALTGNSINMEHLSTATYIVKATDNSNNEELTYKVVKN